MLKSKSILEVKVGDRIYTFECEPNAPLGEVHDVLLNMKHFVIQKISDVDKAKEEQPPGDQ